MWPCGTPGRYMERPSSICIAFHDAVKWYCTWLARAILRNIVFRCESKVKTILDEETPDLQQIQQILSLNVVDRYDSTDMWLKGPI